MSKKWTGPTEAFRQETVRLLESSGKSVPELAREMGINEKSLYRWQSQYGRVNGASKSARIRIKLRRERVISGRIEPRRSNSGKIVGTWVVTDG